MYFTHYAEEKILNALRGETLTPPSQFYAAAYLSNPSNAGGGTEIAYVGYSRKIINFSPPEVGVSGWRMSNVADINFGESSQAANSIRYLAVMDAVVGGNMWAFMALDEPIEVVAGVDPLVVAREWNYELIGNASNSFAASVLNVLRGIVITGITPHIGLFNGNPDEGGAELAGGAYERFPVGFTLPSVQPSGQTIVQNAEQISSNRATSNWGTWSWTVIMSARTLGEPLLFVQKQTPTIMGSGRRAMYHENELRLSLN